MLSMLASNGLEVDVYGQDWEKTKLAGMKNVLCLSDCIQT